jgi:hypothetical protein
MNRINESPGQAMPEVPKDDSARPVTYKANVGAVFLYIAIKTA